MSTDSNIPTGITDPASVGALQLIEESIDINIEDLTIDFQVRQDGSFAKEQIDISEITTDIIQELHEDETKMKAFVEQKMESIKNYDWEPE